MKLVMEDVSSGIPVDLGLAEKYSVQMKCIAAPEMHRLEYVVVDIPYY